MVGYDKVIIIDAIKTTRGKPGQIYRLDLESFKATQHAVSTHDINLTTAIELGKRLGLAMPQNIDILAIEVIDIDHFSEECTPEVASAIPECVEMIINELKESSTTRNK